MAYVDSMAINFFLQLKVMILLLFILASPFLLFGVDYYIRATTLELVRIALLPPNPYYYALQATQ